MKANNEKVHNKVCSQKSFSFQSSPSQYTITIVVTPLTEFFVPEVSQQLPFKINHRHRHHRPHRPHRHHRHHHPHRDRRRHRIRHPHPHRYRYGYHHCYRHPHPHRHRYRHPHHDHLIITFQPHR